MTERCETCVNWEGNFAVLRRWLSRDPIPEGDGDNWGLCKLVEQPTSGEKAAVTAYVMDGEDYGSDLVTRRNFGCILHEEVDNDDPTTDRSASGDR